MESEKKIAQLVRQQAQTESSKLPIDLTPIVEKTVLAARKEVLNLHLSPALEDYIVHVVIATREPAKYAEDLGRWIRFGASPRATIGLERCARAHAWLQGRDYVSPEDIQAMAHNVLSHRVLLSFEAEADGITPDRFVSEVLSRVAVP